MRMTRFWITLDQAVNFVLNSFKIMQGGEIFVPKIPSIKIVNLAKAMAPELKHKIIGIRPGEKLHEKMISENESHLTLSFRNYFLIKPSIKFYSNKKKYNKKGFSVSKNFEYRSDNNPKFLKTSEIKKLIKNYIV